LRKLIDVIAANVALTDSRKRREAQYLFKELRGLYRFARVRAREKLQQIYALDGDFTPLKKENSTLFRWFGHRGLLSQALKTYGLVSNIMNRTRALAR